VRRSQPVALCACPQVYALEGRLSYIRVDELDWFGETTVSSLPTPASYSDAVHPDWRQRALAMLRITSPHLVGRPEYTGAADPVPLYELGMPPMPMDPP
jgi:hypothetical protein